MKHRYGTPDVVEVREVPVPVPAEGEVLVRVRAASVNRADLDGIEPRPGFMRLFMGLRAPRNPRIGWDVAGTVETAGPGATRFDTADRVFADLGAYGAGSFAEYVAAPERAFEPIPDGLSFDDASTLPHSAVLALQGLRTRKDRTVQAGDRVLIVGASGNVGPFAVQIAKAMGAHVTGVASKSKLDLVRSIGADAVIDYQATDFTRTGERWDWILDTDTHASFLGVRRALTPHGVYATLGGGTGAILRGLFASLVLSRFGDKWTGLMLWWKPFHRPDVDRLKALVAAGKLRPVIDRRYPLSEAREALRLVHERRSRGKVVITMESTDRPT
jgi:NADPH:quinone reductase-like Zn-dependent oxidoreductase